MKRNMTDLTQKTWTLENAIEDAEKRAMQGRDAVEYVLGAFDGESISTEIHFERNEVHGDDDLQVHLETIEFFPEPHVCISDEGVYISGDAFNEKLWSVCGEEFEMTHSEIVAWMHNEAKVDPVEPDTLLQNHTYGPQPYYYTEEQREVIEDVMQQSLAQHYKDQGNDQSLQMSKRDWLKVIASVEDEVQINASEDEFPLEHLEDDINARITGYDVKAWFFGSSWSSVGGGFATPNLNHLMDALEDKGLSPNIHIWGHKPHFRFA